MKKVASFALAATLAASLAASAGAAGIAHTGDCDLWNDFVNGSGVPGYTNTVFNTETAGWWFGDDEVWHDMGALAQTAATVSSYTRVKLPRGARSTYTSDAEAITSKELVKACEDAGVANLTVFKQRNVTGVAEPMTVKLWTVGKKNSVVVLFRAAGQTDWTVAAVGEAGEKEIADFTLPAADGAYAVCMAW